MALVDDPLSPRSKRENSDPVLIGSIVFQPARIVQRREPLIRTQFPPPGIGVVKCCTTAGGPIDSINLVEGNRLRCIGKLIKLETLREYSDNEEYMEGMYEGYASWRVTSG